MADFVYGRFPIQGNAGRTNPLQGRVWDSRGSDGPEDAPGPEPTGSPVLDPELDNHNIVYDSYNGYPANEPKEPMPDVTGVTISMARQLLQKSGFVLGDVTTGGPQGEWEADPLVVTQSVAAGTVSERWTVVDIATVEEEDGGEGDGDDPEA